MVTVKKRKFKPVSKGDTGLPIMSGGDQALHPVMESRSQKDDPAKRHDAGKPGRSGGGVYAGGGPL